jgi:hypothetical protein
MEEKEGSPEVSLSVIANFYAEIPAQLRIAQDEEPP